MKFDDSIDMTCRRSHIQIIGVEMQHFRTVFLQLSGSPREPFFEGKLNPDSPLIRQVGQSPITLYLSCMCHFQKSGSMKAYIQSRRHNGIVLTYIHLVCFQFIFIAHGA